MPRVSRTQYIYEIYGRLTEVQYWAPVRTPPGADRGAAGGLLLQCHFRQIGLLEPGVQRR